MYRFSKLSRFLYQNPSDSANTPFQRADNIDQAPFVWIVDHPFNFEFFIQWMTAQREGQLIWLDVFLFEKTLCHNVGSETSLFVDVGGGIGHQCVALKSRFPHLSGRAILQDLSDTSAVYFHLRRRSNRPPFLDTSTCQRYVDTPLLIFSSGLQQ